MEAKSPLAKALVHLILIGGSAVFLFPLVWMISTSVKPISQTQELPPRLTPYRETVTGEDGKSYPSAFYEPPQEEITNPDETEKQVALLSREGDRAQIEVAGLGTSK